jgi:hypothetical protein
VFNAAKFLDSSISRLKALPKMKPRKGAHKEECSLFFQNFNGTKQLVVAVHQSVKKGSGIQG